MKNFSLLATKCEGFTPLAVVGYVQKCTHSLHIEKVFAGMLKYACAKINENTNPKTRCFLYNQSQEKWPEEAQKAFQNAEEIYKEEYGNEANIVVYKFCGEEKFNYYIIRGQQLGEKIEVLFLEEI